MNNNDLTRVISNILGEFRDWKNISMLAEHTPTGKVDITFLVVNQDDKTEKYTTENWYNPIGGVPHGR